MNQFDAVVFDVDGVLVDSEPIHAWTWMQVLTRHGIEVTAEEIDRFIGIPCRVMLGEFQDRVGIELPDTVVGEKEALFSAVMPERIRPMKGIGDVLAVIHSKGTPMGAASNSPVGRVRDMLAAVGFDSYFKAVAGIDEVPAAKPAPDVYLLACERLGVTPARCLAVEDSPTGVAAAAAAGLTVWAYVHAFPETVLTEAGADAVIEKFTNISDRL
jgi:HAD superfamily hydrolase (TIGR01509 family)